MMKPPENDPAACERRSPCPSIQRLFETPPMFRTIIHESLPCGVMAMDSGGHLLYANRHLARLTGWSRNALRNAPFPYPFWPTEPEVGLDALLDERYPEEGMTLWFRKKDGGRFQGLLACAPFIGDSGEPAGRILAIADVAVCRRSEQALRLFSSKVISAREKERRRMARGLHDSVGGKLTAIKYGLEKAIVDPEDDPEVLREALKDVLNVVHATIDETQRICKNLHPAILDDLGLLPAMNALLREFQDIYTGIRVLPRWEFEEDDVADDLKILIYRVTQEALNNVAKHSGAGEATVSLRSVEDRITLRIQDDGAGFDPDRQVVDPAQGEGMGIDSMKERTELFGGRFKLISAPGCGTTVQAIWRRKLSLAGT